MIQTDWPKFPGFWHCHHHPQHSGKGQESSRVRQSRGRASTALQAVPAPSQGSVGPAAGISIHLDFTLPDADAFGKAANKAERFLLALQAAKVRQAPSSFSCCQAWPGLRLHSESPARWRLPGEVSPLTHCWQGINNKRQDSTMQWGKRKVPCGGSSALCKGARASPWPPGLRVQPLWALLLLPVWWEMPDPLGNRPKATLSHLTQSQGWARRAALFPAIVQSVGREAAAEICRHRWCWIRSSPITRGTDGAARGGRGRREQASVQHCIQLVSQVVKHVADVFQDVLG